MKIAILSSIAWRTPPRKYGPWEQVASNIAEGMVERGIDMIKNVVLNLSPEEPSILTGIPIDNSQSG